MSKPTESEIYEAIEIANEITDAGTSLSRYADGVAAALNWALGDYDDPPLSEDDRP